MLNLKIFINYHYVNIRRQGNQQAHLLAKYVLGIDNYMTWMEENPYFLEQTLLHDVISIANN